ncbi:MAG: hypothetical protein Q8O19_05415 [Rectinemataceae bacterium]|nr:hypothetical protein [Rectinemataceae bacterium]
MQKLPCWQKYQPCGIVPSNHAAARRRDELFVQIMGCTMAMALAALRNRLVRGEYCSWHHTIITWFYNDYSSSADFR